MKSNLVLIVSDDYDTTTVEVCKWLKYFHDDFIRINRYDALEIVDAALIAGKSDIKLKTANRSFALQDIKSYWFRRGELVLTRPEIALEMLGQSMAFEGIVRQIQKDYKRIEDFLHHLIHRNIRTLGDFRKRHNNKLIHLQIAGDLGLQVPDTFFEKTRARLLELIQQYPAGIITKVVSDAEEITVSKGDSSFYYYIFTNKITQEYIESIPESFPLSQIQPVIEKIADIRVFYIDHKFYSMAIFSQSDQQTSIDFRRYNYKVPNRNVPFQLPKSIENKLESFMTTIGLNSGSIDIIYGIDKQFYFLEVNPVGQFGMVSQPCNYFLEREVASFLSANK